MTDVLDKAGLAYEIYSDIKANPTIENVQNGVAAFKAAKADYIVAIGGGSSMDTAKAIGIIIANPEFEDVRSLEGVALQQNPVFQSLRSDNCRNSCRSYHQLCDHRCGKKKKIGLCGSA